MTVSSTLDKDAKKDDWCPRMSGNFHGYRPQWKHSGLWGPVNKRYLKLDGGSDWTNVQYTVHRGAMSIRLPDGTEVPVGIPFPNVQSGILETIGLCGYAQALALAWNFAAYVQAAGGEVEVRAECYEISYDMKARIAPVKEAA